MFLPINGHLPIAAYLAKDQLQHYEIYFTVVHLLLLLRIVGAGTGGSEKARRLLLQSAEGLGRARYEHRDRQRWKSGFQQGLWREGNRQERGARRKYAVCDCLKHESVHFR